jgi:type I restriction enzyme S subunit
MTRDTFFASFGYMADAPNGVKKLRALILQLAVQGKLVPQDPNDEPASRLLKRIQVEKARLAREKKIKKVEPLLPVNPDEVPYELPKRWEWVRLEEVFYPISTSGNKVNSSQMTPTGNYPVVDQGQSHIAGYINDAEKLISIPGPVIVFGDHTRAIKYIDFDFVAGADGVKILRPIQIYEPYFFWVLKNLNLEDRGYGRHYRILMSNLFPLSSLAEQRRIVAKVDQLMALCDELEKRQQKKKRKLFNLNNAALDRLLTAREPDDFANAWRLIRDNFDFLYTAPEAITKLRQGILQLAVQGILVPQDPNDEPAAVLLAKIKAEKDRLVQEKKIKKSDPMPPVSPAEAPFELPKGWGWVRLYNLCEVITKGSSPKWQGINYSDADRGILFITSENVGNYKLRLEEPKYVEAQFNEIEPRSILRKNDILMNIVGASIGRTAVYDIDDSANINQAVCLIRLVLPDTYVLLAYMLHFFNSPIFIYFMFDKQVDNARANLSMGNISKFVIPLPPIAEQHRIVTKVYQIMKLCDELKAKLIKSQTKSEKLVEAAVKIMASG